MDLEAGNVEVGHGRGKEERAPWPEIHMSYLDKWRGGTPPGCSLQQLQGTLPMLFVEDMLVSLVLSWYPCCHIASVSDNCDAMS
jgi:hypothetical protein